MDYIEWRNANHPLPPGCASFEDIIRYNHKQPGPKGSGWIHYLKTVGMYDELVGSEKHQFITVALPNDYPISKILKYVDSPHKYFRNNSIMSIEKYSSTGVNLHVHLLKKGNYSKTKIIRDLSKKFKIESNFVDVKSSDDRTLYQTREAYVKGEKVEPKCEYVMQDREWRKTEKIKDYYIL